MAFFILFNSNTKKFLINFILKYSCLILIILEELNVIRTTLYLMKKF